METTRIDSLFQRAQALFSGAKACYNRGRVKQTGEEHPMQIMDQFGAAPGAEIGFGEIPYQEKQVMYLCADISDLEKDTGFAPRVTFAEGIEKTVDWCRKNYV